MTVSDASHRTAGDVPSFGAVVMAVLLGAAALAVARAPEGSLLKIAALPSALVLGAAVAVVIAVGARFGGRGERAISLLAFSFVLTGWQYDTGFIVLEAPQVGAAVCLGIWAMQIIKHRRFNARLDGVGLLAALVVLAAWFSFFGALDVSTWFKRAMRITWLFGLYLYFVNNADSPRRMAVFLRGGLVACAIAGLVLFAHSVALIYQGGAAEFFGPGGTFVNTNEAATYLAIFVVLAMALYASGEHLTVLGARSLLFVLSAMMLGIVATRSRTGLTLAVLVPAVLFVRSRRVRRMLAVGAVFVAVTWNVPAVNIFEKRLLSTLGMSGDADYDQWIATGTDDRLYWLELYWNVIEARPIFGMGAGNYNLIRDLDIEIPDPPRRGSWTAFDYLDQSSHNGFINWWAETGTLGVLPFVASLMYAALATWRAARSRRVVPWWRAIAIGGFGALGVFIMTNMTGEFGVSQARYWMLLAMASVVAREAERSRRLPSQGPVRRLGGNRIPVGIGSSPNPRRPAASPSERAAAP